jgi:hypothetical protein
VAVRRTVRGAGVECIPDRAAAITARVAIASPDNFTDFVIFVAPCLRQIALSSPNWLTTWLRHKRREEWCDSITPSSEQLSEFCLRDVKFCLQVPYDSVSPAIGLWSVLDNEFHVHVIMTTPALNRAFALVFQDSGCGELYGDTCCKVLRSEDLCGYGRLSIVIV